MPFIGPPGDLLERLIEAVFHRIKWETTYGFTNTVACVPYTSKTNKQLRPPTVNEKEACQDRLTTTINTLAPTAIILVGKTATSSRTKLPKGIPTLSLTHPAYLLRKGGFPTPEAALWINDLSEFLKNEFPAANENANRSGLPLWDSLAQL
jgi:uracil-DNA glycosylase